MNVSDIKSASPSKAMQMHMNNIHLTVISDERCTENHHCAQRVAFGETPESKTNSLQLGRNCF